LATTIKLHTVKIGISVNGYRRTVIIKLHDIRIELNPAAPIIHIWTPSNLDISCKESHCSTDIDGTTSTIDDWVYVSVMLKSKCAIKCDHVIGYGDYPEDFIFPLS
jgi:hypothetical protein